MRMVEQSLTVQINLYPSWVRGGENDQVKT